MLKKRNPVPIYTSNANSVVKVTSKSNSNKRSQPWKGDMIGCSFLNDSPHWATSQSRYGIDSGKAFYECTIGKGKICNRDGICRVGWAVDGHQDCTLGTVEGSYGYGGTGWRSTGGSFHEYGERFGENDVIGCAIDLDIRIISYYKNGVSLGTAFQLPDEIVTYIPVFAAVHGRMQLNFGLAPFQYPIEGYSGLANAEQLHPARAISHFQEMHDLFYFCSSRLNEYSDINMRVEKTIKTMLKLEGQFTTKAINMIASDRGYVQPGDTLLHVASRTNNIPLIRLLIFTGIDIKIRNKWGRMAADVENATGATRYFILLHAKFQHNIKENSILMKAFAPVKWANGNGSINIARFTTHYLEGDTYNKEYQLFRESRSNSFFDFYNRLKDYLKDPPSPALFTGQDEKTRAEQQELFMNNKAVKVLFNPDYQYLITPFL